MRRVIAVCVLPVVALAVLAGCGDPPGFARRAAAPPAAATSPEPAFDRGALAARLTRVLLAQEALLDVGGPTRAADGLDGDYATSYYCFAFPDDEGRTGHVAHERLWLTPTFTVSNVVHGYNRKTGVEAVREARDNAQRCTTYQLNVFKTHTDRRKEFDENVRHDLLGAVEFAAASGIEDSYGRCERETYAAGDQRFVCAAFLGRKNLVSALFVSGVDEAAAKAKLLQIVPKAAAALAIA